MCAFFKKNNSESDEPSSMNLSAFCGREMMLLHPVRHASAAPLSAALGSAACLLVSVKRNCRRQSTWAALFSVKYGNNRDKSNQWSGLGNSSTFALSKADLSLRTSLSANCRGFPIFSPVRQDAHSLAALLFFTVWLARTKYCALSRARSFELTAK